MNLGSPRKRPVRESVVPMINVVFLLLIFFLMTAQITPPEPFEVNPPESSVETPADGQDILYISAEGVLALGELRGEAVLDGLPVLGEAEALMIRADRAVEAEQIAGLLPKLAARGVRRIKLVSVER